MALSGYGRAVSMQFMILFPVLKKSWWVQTDMGTTRSKQPVSLSLPGTAKDFHEQEINCVVLGTEIWDLPVTVAHHPD